MTIQVLNEGSGVHDIEVNNSFYDLNGNRYAPYSKAVIARRKVQIFEKTGAGACPQCGLETERNRCNMCNRNE